MKAKFSNSEINDFLKTLNRPVAWFINNKGNFEFCELNKKSNPVYRGTVWFKLVRTNNYLGGNAPTRFWKCAKNSSHWQLFRNSKTGTHESFDNLEMAAYRMKEYMRSHDDRAIYDSSAKSMWPTKEQERDFCDRSEGRINYYVPMQ